MKTSDILKLNDDQFEKQLNLFDAIPNSRTLTKDEEHELHVRVAELEHTFKKCSGSNLVSHELEPIVSEFEAANYNLGNLNPATKMTLQSTYDELKYCVESDPKTFKNSSAKLYCDIYEMFRLNKAAEAMNKLKSSKFFKGINLSKESYSIESLEAYLASTNGELSTEGVFSPAKLIDRAIHKSHIREGVDSIQWVGIVFSIALLLITVAVIALCVISAQYKTELAKILDKLSDDDVKTKGALKTRQDNTKAAAIAMEENTHGVTKMVVYKGAKYAVRQINKLAKADYSELDRSAEDLNRDFNECYSKIAESKEGAEEAAAQVAATATKTFANKVVEFLTKYKRGIMVAIGIGMVISLIKVGIPLLRACIYHFKSWRISVSNFFNEQSELTEANIEYLIEQRDDPSTSEMEKARLDKIIQKQRVWIKNMSSWANMFYKSEVDAASDTNYEIRQDEKVNFDKIATETEEKEQEIETNLNIDASDTTGSVDVDVPVSNPNKPVILF